MPTLRRGLFLYVVGIPVPLDDKLRPAPFLLPWFAAQVMLTINYPYSLYTATYNSVITNEDFDIRRTFAENLFTSG